MALYRDSAVVLRTYKLGEADRIVVLMARAHGKVRAVAKGVRRTGSRFGSRMEPGSVVQVQLYEGSGELDGVSQAETSEGASANPQRPVAPRARGGAPGGGRAGGPGA
ncbi:MAG: DNA repair protein RecO [Microthrixaceae bacterium]|nr:DNA repair protein RecO [Microthrixaceae bacterium]